MSQQDGKDWMHEGCSSWIGPSEPQSYTEHQAALDATIFRTTSDPSELVLELEAGKLRFRRPGEA